MGVGYPDFFGQSIFLSYGITKNINEYAQLLSSGNYVDLCLVESKGKVSNGWINIRKNTMSYDYTIQIWIDGYLACEFNTVIIDLFNLWDVQDYPIVARFFDASKGNLSLGIKGDITFSNSIFIRIKNDTSSIISVSAELNYTEVVR